MKRVFRSSFNLWILIITVAILAVGPICILMSGFTKSDLFALLIVLLVELPIVDMLARTRYVVSDNTLHLKLGTFVHAKINIQKIEKITHKHTLLSDDSYAWDSDRLIIWLPRKRKYMVSPKRRSAFLKALTDVNPAIKVEI